MPATPIKLTPLRTATEHLGAKFTEMAGWQFAEVYTTPEAEIAAARKSVALADVTPHGKIQIEGAVAAEALKTAFGDAPEVTGGHAQLGASHLYRLRHDQFYLTTPPGAEVQALARLEEAIAQARFFVTITDLTHGLAETLILGPASRGVLSKLCGLDFRPDKFPDRTARQSSLAKTKQLILRRDLGGLPAYSILGAQSLAAYVWDVSLEAGREFGLVPIGVAALRILEKSQS